jgi:hypothetical protein
LFDEEVKHAEEVDLSYEKDPSADERPWRARRTTRLAGEQRPSGVRFAPGAGARFDGGDRDGGEPHARTAIADSAGHRVDTAASYVTGATRRVRTVGAAKCGTRARSSRADAQMPSALTHGV